MIRNNTLPVLLFLILVLCTGCTQYSQPSSQPVEIPAVQTEQAVETQTGIHAENITQNLTNGSETVSGITTKGGNETNTAIPITSQPTRKPDPNVIFRDRMVLTLDDMQSAKDGILASYHAGDIARVREKSIEFSKTISNKSIITDMPSKMDYVRMNYYEYIDQAGQFSQSFSDGANRWMASDKASANSLFDAAIMASDRADIADKRIRTFFRDHVLTG